MTFYASRVSLSRSPGLPYIPQLQLRQFQPPDAGRVERLQDGPISQPNPKGRERSERRIKSEDE